MAIPSDLASWRDYVARTEERPETLTWKQLRSLGDDARREYDQRRMRWLAADVVLKTPDVQELGRLWAVLRAHALADSALLPRTLAISGQATFGKTTSALWIARDHERRARKQLGDSAGENFQPSIYFVTPAATTPKMLMASFCRTLGLPYTQREDAQLLTERVIHVLRQMRTSLIVVDEIHNVNSNRRAGAEAAGVLKQFVERLDAVFLLAGIDLERAALFRGTAGEQLANRSMIYRMRGYSRRGAADRESWASLVASCEALLPLARARPQSLLPFAQLLFDATGGSIGQLRRVLRLAAIDSILSGTELIDRNAIERQLSLRPFSQATNSEADISAAEVKWRSA